MKSKHLLIFTVLFFSCSYANALEFQWNNRFNITINNDSTVNVRSMVSGVADSQVPRFFAACRQSGMNAIHVASASDPGLRRGGMVRAAQEVNRIADRANDGDEIFDIDVLSNFTNDQIALYDSYIVGFAQNYANVMAFNASRVRSDVSDQVSILSSEAVKAAYMATPQVMNNACIIHTLTGALKDFSLHLLCRRRDDGGYAARSPLLTTPRSVERVAIASICRSGNQQLRLVIPINF